MPTLTTWEGSDLPCILQSPTVDQDDIDQEAELLKLLGKPRKKSLIAMELSLYEALIFSGEIDAGFDCQNPWASSSVPCEEDINRLLDWAMTQSEAIAYAILQYLEEPSDEAMRQVLSQTNLDKGQPATNKPMSFADLIRQLLAEKPCTLTELYAYARTLHLAKRPEATVRQLLRRLEKQGEILLKEDRYYLAHK